MVLLPYKLSRQSLYSFPPYFFSGLCTVELFSPLTVFPLLPPLTTACFTVSFPTFFYFSRIFFLHCFFRLLSPNQSTTQYFSSTLLLKILLFPHLLLSIHILSLFLRSIYTRSYPLFLLIYPDPRLSNNILLNFFFDLSFCPFLCFSFLSLSTAFPFSYVLLLHSLTFSHLELPSPLPAPLPPS